MPFEIRYEEEDEDIWTVIPEPDTDEEDDYAQACARLIREKTQRKKEQLEEKLRATFERVNERISNAYSALLMEFDESEHDRAARMLVALDSAAYILEGSCHDDRECLS